jgi:hypothetical protein
VYYYTNPVVYPEAPVQYVQPYQQQPQQQPYVVQQQGQTAVGGVAQGYIYVNPVVGGGQPQAYVVSQVGNQQVLVPCPVDYNVGYNNYNVPVVQEKVPVVPVPVVKQQQQQQVVQQQQDAIIKGREQVYQQQGNKRQPTNVNVGVGGVGKNCIGNVHKCSLGQENGLCVVVLGLEAITGFGRELNFIAWILQSFNLLTKLILCRLCIKFNSTLYKLLNVLQPQTIVHRLGQPALFLDTATLPVTTT